jgi:hypothetical protein
LLDTIVNSQQRLTVWRNFKKQDLEINKVISYVGSIKTTERAFDFYSPGDWPTSWEIISESMFCHSGKALLLHDTLAHMGLLDTSTVSWFVADNHEFGQVGLAFSDGVCYYNILPNQTVKRQELDNYIRVLEKIKHNKLDKIKR